MFQHTFLVLRASQTYAQVLFMNENAKMQRHKLQPQTFDWNIISELINQSAPFSCQQAGYLSQANQTAKCYIDSF